MLVQDRAAQVGSAPRRWGRSLDLEFCPESNGKPLRGSSGKHGDHLVENALKGSKTDGEDQGEAYRLHSDDRRWWTDPGWEGW